MALYTLTSRWDAGRAYACGGAGHVFFKGCCIFFIVSALQTQKCLVASELDEQLGDITIIEPTQGGTYLSLNTEGKGPTINA